MDLLSTIPPLKRFQYYTQTTVQDFPGRVGYWDIGAAFGPMDTLAFLFGEPAFAG